jgi:hypothetical protein
VFASDDFDPSNSTLIVDQRTQVANAQLIRLPEHVIDGGSF